MSRIVGVGSGDTIFEAEREFDKGQRLEGRRRRRRENPVMAETDAGKHLRHTGRASQDLKNDLNEKIQPVHQCSP